MGWGGSKERASVISREDPRGDNLFGRESIACAASAKVRMEGCVSVEGSKQIASQ